MKDDGDNFSDRKEDRIMADITGKRLPLKDIFE